MTPEDKIVEAIDRNTESLESVGRFIFSGAILIWFVLLLILCAIGCPRAESAPLMPPLDQLIIIELGDPPAPPPNPNVQYWYTMDVPGPAGVLPVEVFASRLVGTMASAEVGVEVPEPGTLMAVIVGWLALNAILLAHWAFVRLSRVRFTRTLFVAGASTKPVASVAKVRIRARYSTQVVAREKVDVYHGKVEVVK